ncbi:hemerythrin domain-containing protein [Asanoa sp. WMMD1127]|uniref:hemerythrin domain-containing protein n=1 Tax=Asanoa sp. WMMD1127 TaxID=3016107 RepID=UPI0024165F35|nr:hemerythrin domain-containing protein [Asanoa sp. WMMD1127]MDG4824060.1 hemerythrin domain-containing protein [Asanoa sp. WMMD1127]
MTATDEERDVVDLLRAQHDEIRALFTLVRSSTGDRKREAFQELVRLLAVHESAEEQVVHPAARGDGDDAVVDARLREEAEAKQVLADLYDLGVEHPKFDIRFADFEDGVLSHALNEERDEFPALRRRHSPEKLRRMAEAVEAAEAIAPTRPHPAAGENPVTNLLAGPPVAIVDKARDAVRDWRQSRDA